MTPTELTAAGYTVAEQVKAYGLVATCYDIPATAPRSAWERALRLVRK